MKKIDLKANIIDLKGETLLDQDGKALTVSGLVSNYLLQVKDDNSIKLYDWAQRIYKDGFIELDDSDLAKLKKIIEDSAFPVISKAQILKAIG